MYSFVKGGNKYRYLHFREQWPYWPEKKENPRQGCSPTGLSFTFWNKDLKEIFNTLMTIARVKLLMLLVRVILPKTALVLWILKFNINVRVIPTIHTSLCPIFVYIPKNYRSMLFFKFILTTKYFRQQPDSLRNLIDMFFFFIFDPSWNVWAISSGLSECFGLCAREHCLHGRDLSLLNVHVVERIDALSV